MSQSFIKKYFKKSFAILNKFYTFKSSKINKVILMQTLKWDSTATIVQRVFQSLYQ